jgi:hypothetical protein
MIGGDLPAEEVCPYLLGCPWFADYTRHGFRAEPEDLVESLLSEMLRSGPPGGEMHAWRLYYRTLLLQAGSLASTGPEVGQKRRDEPARNGPKKLAIIKGSAPPRIAKALPGALVVASGR